MKYIFTALFFLLSSNAFADVSYELEQLMGWTIVDVKTIEGHQERGEQKQIGFEGCNGDTYIYFIDGSVAQCMSLGLQLALMPKAIIFGKKTTYQGKEIIMYKMLVKEKTYSIFFSK